MVEPAQRGRDGGPAGDPAPSLLIEAELWRYAALVHSASNDLILHTIYVRRVLERLREVAPELVRAAEEEVAFGA